MTNFHMAGTEALGRTLTVIYDSGEVVPVTDKHPNFQSIVNLLLSGEADDDSVRELVNKFVASGAKLARLTERVTVDTHAVYFDGDVLRGELADAIKEAAEDENAEKRLTALSNFLEKVKTNPSVDSVDQFFRWITNKDLVITPTGNIIAYKGTTVSEENGEKVYRSIHSGPAIVDGKRVNGHVPNQPGSVIEMPRSDVNADRGVGCSTGLHAGTYAYASSFSHGGLLTVEINPRDIVSVPDDSSFQKLRVSRYVVIAAVEHRIESNFADASYDPDEDWDEDEDDWDEEDYEDDYEDEDEEDYDEENYESDDEDDDECSCGWPH